MDPLVEGLCLLMNDVVGPAYHGRYHMVVCHKYDYNVGGFNHHSLGWVSDEVMHGCYTVLVLHSGSEYIGRYKAPEYLGWQWIFGIFEVFMSNGVGCMYMCGPEAWNVMAFFNIW